LRLFLSHPAWTTRKKRAPLRSVIDVSGLAGVMLALLFLMIFGEMYPMYRHLLPVDMAVTLHSSPLPNAERDDAVTIAITRDGTLYLNHTRILPADLPEQLRDMMHDNENKTVYVKADARVKYGDVKVALDGIRSANVRNIAFLTESARAASTP
jgi:biopolymer transport protein TolR